MRKGLRVRTALAVAITAAAVFGATATSASAQGPPPMPDFIWTDMVWLSPQLTSWDGEPYRIFGGRCNDEGLDNIIVNRTWPRTDDLSAPTPRQHPCSGYVVPNSHRPLTFTHFGGEQRGLIAAGVTAARIDAVDLLTKAGWVRVRTWAVPADSIAAGGLPEGLRAYATTAPWDSTAGPDGPFWFQGAVGVTNGKIAACSRELACVKGVSAKRAGKYGKRVKRARRR